MFSATVYSIFHSFKPSNYMFHSREADYLGDPDFLTVYGLIVDIASLNTTPAFVIFCLQFRPGVEHAGAAGLGLAIGWMVIIQSGLFLFGIFVISVYENASRTYMSIMPYLKHYSIVTAEIICPIAIFVMGLIRLLTLPDYDDINHLMQGSHFLFVMLA